jgi:WD40 repeat protein
MINTMKHKTFLIMAAIFVVAFTADSFAQLTKIWDLSNNNFALERLCGPGKLAVVSLDGINQFLIELTNGETIHSTMYPETVYFNYFGDRYYVYNITENIIREYDLKSKQFIKIVHAIAETSDSAMGGFNYSNHSLLFYNANTGEVLDSFKIPNTPNEPSYSTYAGSQFSNDGRFFAFFMQKNFQPTAMHFLLYDRQAREIIMQKDLPVNGTFNFRFFNTKNHMAYAENIKLPEDDKAYSYIRIYDPEKREVVKNLKLFDDDSQYPSFITFRQDDKIFAHGNGKNNDIHFFDLENDKKIEFVIKTFPGPLYLDDTLYIAGSFEGFKFDWNAVGVEDEANPNIPVIYPNPSTNTVNLIISDAYFNGIWEITDLTGRVILSGIILPNPQLQINIEHLTAQTYYLRLQKENFTVTYQVVKL